ncbi:hypothetical protein C2G38_2182619 [Gigaspora rosea]|uniref:Uncharacterized protein n=1 Tax=Gigaspora rosea TaxID=44941 RepID=A0A397VB42_9GLOM|nr:hypothetical protein C2G38_2182619 [Gigaspora rosea]
MQPTIESLRELNSRLVLKIDELRKKYTEIEAENTELKGEKTVFLAKEAELMARIVELEQSAKENAENSKLRDSELNELRSRVSKLEQKQLKNNIVHRLKDGDNSFENVNVPDPAINQCIDTNTELLEDKEMIDFLDEKNKKRKLLRESDKDQFQDLSSDNYNISSDISCNTKITNEQDSLSVSHIISTNCLCKLKKEEALIQEISLEKNYTNKNLSSDREKKPRF